MAKCIAPIVAKGSTRKNPIFVNCGYCGYCLLNRKQDWKLRLTEEFKQSPWTFFVTLTYNPENLPTILTGKPILSKHSDLQQEMSLFTLHAQKFTRALRKINKRLLPNHQLRYYACGEYGERFGRPHYHYIIFNLHPDAAQRIPEIWNKGFCKIELVKSSSKVSNYVSGYVIKAFTKARTLKVRPMSLMSKKPFIGHSYVTRMADYHRKLNQPYLDLGKYRQRLPRIFKRKIWSTALPDKHGGEWKFAPSCTLPGHKPERATKYYDPLITPQYDPPPEWKEQNEIQQERLYQNRLHELYLMYGAAWDAEGYLAIEQHYNERKIFLNFKTNDQQ